MAHLQVDPPAFFRRGPSPLARFALFGLLSIALLFLDTRFRYLETLRQVDAVVILPLQYAMQLPQRGFAYVGDYLATQRALNDENATLKRQLVAQGPAVQGFPDAQEENARLRALLELRARYRGAATAVEVLYAGHDPFAQKVFIDRGANAGIKPGEAVIDAQGVVGQVTRVYPSVAEVTILTDKDHAVPVRVERNGMRSVLFGAGADARRRCASCRPTPISALATRWSRRASTEPTRRASRSHRCFRSSARRARCSRRSRRGRSPVPTAASIC
jgi:rod shape-determining protein MreC